MVETKKVRFVSRYHSLRLTVNIGKNDIGHVKFSYGEFVTSDAGLIAGLRKHPAYGRDFFEDKEQESDGTEK